MKGRKTAGRIQLRHLQVLMCSNILPNVQTHIADLLACSTTHIPPLNAIMRPDLRMLLGRSHEKRREDGWRVEGGGRA